MATLLLASRNLKLEYKIKKLKIENIIDVCIIIGALIFYCFSLQNGVGGRILVGNAIKFQYVGWIPGVPHAPGFPLYTMISWLWLHLPLPVSVAWQSNLLSAVFASFSLVFFRRGLSKIGVGVLAAVITTIGLALSGCFWMRATEAGPLALSFFLATTLFLFIIKWLKNHESKNLYLTFLVLFLIAGNALSFQWLVPLILLFLIFENPKKWGLAKTWVALLVALFIGLSLFVYIYIRSNQQISNLEFIQYNASPKNVFYFALGEQFWPNYFFANWKIIFEKRLPELFIFLINQFNYIGFLFILIGALAVWKLFRKIALLGVLTASVAVASVIHLYSPILKFQYWIFYLIAAYSCGIGLDFLCKRPLLANIKIYLIIIYLITIFSYAYSNNRHLFNKANKFDVEQLLMAFPLGKKSVCIVDDLYTWQQVLRYYETTNPFIKKRKIKLSDTIKSDLKSYNLFFLDSVKSKLDLYGISYLPLCTNENKVLYLIGVNSN